MEPAIVEQNQTKLRSVVSAIWNGLSTGISILVVAVAALVIAVPAAAGGLDRNAPELLDARLIDWGLFSAEGGADALERAPVT